MRGSSLVRPTPQSYLLARERCGLTGTLFLIDRDSFLIDQPESSQSAGAIVGNASASIIVTRSFSGPSGIMP